LNHRKQQVSVTGVLQELFAALLAEPSILNGSPRRCCRWILLPASASRSCMPCSNSFRKKESFPDVRVNAIGDDALAA